MKKYFAKIIMALFVALCVIPLIVYLLSVVPVLPNGGNDWAGFWGGYFGAIIGGICTVGGVFLSIQYEKEKGKEDAERAVLPYIALTTLEKENQRGCFNLKSEDDLKKKESHNEDENDEDSQEYREYLLDKIYFTVQGEEVTPKRRLSNEQRLLVENGGNYKQMICKGAWSIAHQAMIYIPIVLENVGNGAAVNFRVGLHSGNMKYNEKRAKYTIAKHIQAGDNFYLSILFEDLSQYSDEKEFVLRICYENIYAQEYIQEYPIYIESDKTLKMDLGQKQKKQV